ncbi:HDOD domain-containing protein, partial [Pseudomonas sp. CrR25]|nr:HDOD domain-containing protein [Pseudomonas sp. CrR25]
VRRDNRQVPLVMVTGRADRDSVLEVRPLGISAFISKPFQVPKVLECLERLLPAAANDTPPDTDADAQTPGAGTFAEHLAELPASALDLPLQPGMLDGLQPDTGEAPSAQRLNEHWQRDPALTARLVAAANSSLYNSAGTPCLSLIEALHTLGVATSLNIGLGLGLRPAAELKDDELQLHAVSHFEQLERLRARVGELATQCHIDPAPLQTAALLHRLGELCVLHQAQLWRDGGQALSSEQLEQALSSASNQLANRLKAHWRLPNALRELIGACYGLPGNNVRRENILMHLAASELGTDPDSNHLARLRRLAGIP